MTAMRPRSGWCTWPQASSAESLVNRELSALEFAVGRPSGFLRSSPGAAAGPPPWAE
eukprot:CAMPEP_0173375778 /NCGR_PEP_ID=MMETSP1144-20121109/29819_1 /TAXON_ID=483371 /ORGANISM="non described non described, Strain CCMP2298" /LENGTH=56 /DNA_ID=CAMNT_0014328255 /DNA_START=49 /DNA_END=219 /DNA_ORIENTATION=-